MKLLGFLLVLVGSAAAFAPVVPFNIDNRLVRSSLVKVSSVDFKVQFQLFSVSAAEADSEPIYTPLLITNIKTDPIPDSKYGELTFVNGESESDEEKFLYNIKKRDRDYYAKSTKNITKVQELLDGHKHHILLYMHGFREDADCALQSCSKYNSQDEAERKYLVVPIVWNTVHNDRIVKELLYYNEDRTKCFTTVAPTLKVFLEKMLKDQENWEHEYSLMCHSMGNYILRIVAQILGVHAQGDVDPRKAVFENVFMVAADVREDIFDEGLNDFDPKIYPTLATATTGPLSSLGNIKSNIDFAWAWTDHFFSIVFKFKHVNPGLDVASLAKNKVHVLWSSRDRALYWRTWAKSKPLSFIEQFQAWLLGTKHIKIEDGKNVPSGALGRNGNGERNLHDILKNKVVFHNCTDFSKDHAYKHSYQWNKNVVEIFENAIDIDV